MTNDRNHYVIVIATPLPGDIRLGVTMDAEGITHMDFLPASTPLRHGTTPLEQHTEMQLATYFTNPFTPLDISLHPSGTPYQQRVWQTMREIPVGATSRYGELAKHLASGPRAVASACRTNPIPILIPCHRVIARDGLGGYMGETQGEALLIKQWLLHHEGAL